MVRVGRLTYACAPNQQMGRRISDLRLDGQPVEAARKYKVAGWAPVAHAPPGEPVWEVVETYLRAHGTVAPRRVNFPKLLGVEGNPGIAW
jgi:sulfur-oxidizing protein SoxB